MIPAVNHVVVSGVLAGSPEPSRSASGDVLFLIVKVDAGHIPVEIRDPLLASLVFKDASAGAEIFLAGSLTPGASGLVVVVENGRGHDVRVAPAEVVPSPAPDVIPKAGPSNPVRSIVPPSPVTALGRSASPVAGPGKSASASTMDTVVRPVAAPAAAAPGAGMQPRYNVQRTLGYSPKAQVATSPLTAPTVDANRPRQTGMGVLGALRSAKRPMSETEPEMPETDDSVHVFSSESAPPASTSPSLPYRSPGGARTQQTRPAVSDAERARRTEAKSKSDMEEIEKCGSEIGEIPF